MSAGPEEGRESRNGETDPLGPKFTSFPSENTICTTTAHGMVNDTLFRVQRRKKEGLAIPS